MVLLYKIVDLFSGPFQQNSGLFDKFVVFSNKIVDLFGKIVDVLFERGGSSTPREPPLATGLASTVEINVNNLYSYYTESN